MISISEFQNLRNRIIKLEKLLGINSDEASLLSNSTIKITSSFGEVQIKSGTPNSDGQVGKKIHIRSGEGSDDPASFAGGAGGDILIEAGDGGFGTVAYGLPGTIICTGAVRTNSDLHIGDDFFVKGNSYIDGNLQLTGNLQLADSSGIDFSAKGENAGAESEVLYDFEYGTWTPTFYGTTWQNTGSKSGQYFKIGKNITLYLHITASGGNLDFNRGVGFSIPYASDQTNTLKGYAGYACGIRYQGSIGPNDSEILPLFLDYYDDKVYITKDSSTGYENGVSFFVSYRSVQ
jgi:hypothetical protein